MCTMPVFYSGGAPSAPPRPSPPQSEGRGGWPPPPTPPPLPAPLLGPQANLAFAEISAYFKLVLNCSSGPPKVWGPRASL